MRHKCVLINDSEWDYIASNARSITPEYPNRRCTGDKGRKLTGDDSTLVCNAKRRR